MADVSHELGALRFVVDSPLSSKVAMFNNQVQAHKQAQLLNPFSEGSSRSSSPKPSFSKDEYGKPLAGSLTEMRGQKANMHVMKEMLELCQIIHSEGYKVNDEPNMRVIPFGELFNIYNYISDKVVGILLRARKHKLVEFEGEMLFQRRDDDVPIFLIKPITEIRHELEVKIEEMKKATSPAPMATTLLLDKATHQQKLQEAGLNVPGAQNSKSRSPSPSPAKSKAKAAKSREPSPALGSVVNTKAADPDAEAPTSTTQKPKEPEHVENKVEDSPSPPAAAERIVETSPAQEEGKVDINNNDQTTATKEVPTIVLDATAVHVVGSGSSVVEVLPSTLAATTMDSTAQVQPSGPEYSNEQNVITDVKST